MGNVMAKKWSGTSKRRHSDVGEYGGNDEDAIRLFFELMRGELA
jgi:hypothetical protein